MKRTVIFLAAAMACVAAAPEDHALLQRAFARGRTAALESDLYGGKAAVYRPITLNIRIDGVTGEGCETRLASADGIGQGVRVLNWRTVKRIELGTVGRQAKLWIRGGLGDGDGLLIVDFASVEEATPVVLAMERLQAACRTKIGRP